MQKGGERFKKLNQAIRVPAGSLDLLLTSPVWLPVYLACMCGMRWNSIGEAKDQNFLPYFPLAC